MIVETKTETAQQAIGSLRIERRSGSDGTELFVLIVKSATLTSHLEFSREDFKTVAQTMLRMLEAK